MCPSQCRSVTDRERAHVAWTSNQIGVWRARAKARERRTEYIARAYRCGDMAVRACDAQDAQFLGAMTLVWQILADKDADVHHVTDASAPLNFAQIAPPAR